MRLATITLNPAIDQTVLVDHFRIGHVNRATGLESAAGGKGVNVAAFLADYGCAVTVTGFLGEANQQIFQRLFAAKGLADRFIRLPGATRIGIKIADPASQQTTDINLPGLRPTPEAVRDLRQTVEALTAECDWFVLSGNLPPGVDPALYAELIAVIKQRGRQVALDTSGEALRLGLAAGPTLAKPNIHELEDLLGRPLPTLEAVTAAAREQLRAHHLPVLAISMGERGALLATEAAAWLATPPAVTVRSTVGAGDALVAGLVAGLSRGASLEACAQLGTAFSLAVITRTGHAPLDPAALAQNISQVSVTPLEW